MEFTEDLHSRILGFISQDGLFVVCGVVLLAALFLCFLLYLKLRSTVQSEPMQMPEIKQPSSRPCHAAVATRPFSLKIEEKADDVDSMMEEAELYANYGRPTTAVKILEEVVKAHPSKAAAWALLFYCYSSLGSASEFEEAAGEFLKHNKDNTLWSSVQALGRTLDPNNPLYADKNGGAFAVPLLPKGANWRRPVGDILIEMGVLNEEALRSYLDTFNPKKHGRFGGYLLACKKITHAQLNQALLLQGGLARMKSQEV